MKTPLAVTAAKAKYEAADTALQAFLKEYRDLFEEYEQLIIHRNEVLAEYKAAVSDNASKLGSSFGAWKIAIPRKLDGEKLIELLGEEEAEPLLKVKVSVDSKKYDAAVAEGLIDEDMQAVIEGEDTPRLTGPKPIDVYIR